MPEENTFKYEENNTNIIIKENKKFRRSPTQMLCLTCGRKTPTNFQYCPKCNTKLWPIPPIK